MEARGLGAYKGLHPRPRGPITPSNNYGELSEGRVSQGVCYGTFKGHWSCNGEDKIRGIGKSRGQYSPMGGENSNKALIQNVASKDYEWKLDKMKGV